MTPATMLNPIIVALDVESAAAARAMIVRIGPRVNFYKVGLELYTAAGLETVKLLLGEGKQVFLDLKMYDIPETVTRAVAQVAQTGVKFLTVHAVSSVMRAAVAARAGSRLQILGVTVLTSFGPEDMADLGYDGSVAELVERRARKAVELGVRAIVPLHAERSQRIPEARGARRALHWRQIAIAACEQCGRNLVPSIADVVTLDEWMSDRHPENDAIVLDADATTPLAVSARARMPSLVLVGPEGGLTDAERKHAAHRGFIPVRLGASVLRAETAALAALAALLVLQDVR